MLKDGKLFEKLILVICYLQQIADCWPECSILEVSKQRDCRGFVSGNALDFRKTKTAEEIRSNEYRLSIEYEENVCS